MIKGQGKREGIWIIYRLEQIPKKLSQQEVKNMEDWFVVFGWGSPIGIGVFLLCLGGMIYLLSKADTSRKRWRWEEKEKK